MDLQQRELDKSWHEALGAVLAGSKMRSLNEFLSAEKSAGQVIFPDEQLYFHALDLTPLHRVRVVILGQDPYHGDGQAHGLSFSVPKGTDIPPSLRNIYKELESDLGIKPPRHGHLEYWARQGVLLLNSVLSVRRSQAASHQGRGWEEFTDAVIHAVDALDHPVVFMLWGAHAQKKAAFVDRSKHLVLTAPHPSPLSAHRGFLGCKHFSQANDFLRAHGMVPIDWQLPD